LSNNPPVIDLRIVPLAELNETRRLRKTELISEREKGAAPVEREREGEKLKT